MTEPKSDVKVKLQSSQGDEFTVDVEVACLSNVIKAMIDDSGTDDVVPLPNVKTSTLEKVIEYCKYHRENPAPELPKPLKSANLSEVVSKWDLDFISIDQDAIFDLIMAANYLDIKSLLDLTCATIASMIKGKTPEQIRKQFNITNDFTPEEEAQVREENKWCEEA